MGQDFGTWYDAKEQFKSAALEERVKRLAGRRQKPAVPKPQDLLPGGLSSKAAEVSNAANADPALTVTSARQADPHTAEGFMANVDRMLYGEATSGYGKAQNDPYRAAVRIQVMQALEQADKFGGLTPGLARKLSLKIAQDVKSGFSSDKRAAQRADDFARAYSGVPDARSEFLKAAPAAMVGTPVSDPGSPEPLRPLDADEAAVQSPPPEGFLHPDIGLPDVSDGRAVDAWLEKRFGRATKDMGAVVSRPLQAAFPALGSTPQGKAFFDLIGGGTAGLPSMFMQSLPRAISNVDYAADTKNPPFDRTMAALEGLLNLDFGTGGAAHKILGVLFQTGRNAAKLALAKDLGVTPEVIDGAARKYAVEHPEFGTASPELNVPYREPQGKNNAGKISETGQLHEDVRPLPGEGPETVPPQEGGPGVLETPPQAQEIAPTVIEPSVTPDVPQAGAQGPKTADLGAEHVPSVIEHGSGFDPRPAVETALNQGPSGKVHSSAGARFRNFFIENLTDLTKADETGAVLARRLGSADAKAQVLTREAVAEIDRAAGRRGAADDLFKALVESRLRGARDRWTAMGETDNAANVASVLSDAEFQRITGEPWFKPALARYKETMEPALADVHSLNGGVFSDSLGPLDTYYPLTRLDEGGLLPGPKGTGRAMSAPANLRNKMATGLGKDYDTSAAGLAQAMRHMVRSNTKAALIARLKEAGLVTEVPEGSTFHAPGAFEYGGVEYQGRVVPTGRGTQQVFMPEWLARELDPVIGTSGDLSPKAYAKAVNAVNTFALAGPMDAAFHANNLMGVLTSGTPVLPGGVIGNVPLVKRVNAVFQVLKTVPSKDPLLFDKLKELADVGALPTKAMSQTYSRRFAQATGAKFSPASFGPLLYGPNGLDVRARLIMRDVIRSIKPDATPKEVGDFVNQLGAYNKALEATAERRLKQAGIAPFATAGKTMLLQSLRAVTGTTVLPKTTFAKAAAMRSAQQLSSGTVGTVTLWALLYNGATGKWPWEDKGSRLGMVPVPESWEQNPVVKAMATGKKGRAEIDVVRLAAPLVARGFRATGARGAYDAGAAGGDTDQMFDAAVAGMFNSALHPLMSGPIPHAAFTAATGKEPYLLGLRDRRAAFSPSLIDAGPDTGGGLGQAKSNLTMGALAVNPFTMDVAKAVFPRLRSKYEDEQEKAQGASPMDRAASTLVELAFAPTVSRNNKGSVFMSRGRIGFLHDQRKAAKKVRSERGRIDASQGESK